jgi:hypothetical protein
VLIVINPFASVTVMFDPAAKLRSASVTLGVVAVLCVSESYNCTPVAGVIKVSVVLLVVVDGAVTLVLVGEPELEPVPKAVVDVLKETLPEPDAIRLAPMEGI